MRDNSKAATSGTWNLVPRELILKRQYLDNGNFEAGLKDERRRKRVMKKVVQKNVHKNVAIRDGQWKILRRRG